MIKKNGKEINNEKEDKKIRKKTKKTQKNTTAHNTITNVHTQWQYSTYLRLATAKAAFATF